VNPFRWRKMTWLIVLWTVIVLGFGIVTAGDTGDALAGGFAVTMAFGVWFTGFIIFSIIWFMTRPTRRVCPVCGTEVRAGHTVCRKCGHNFAGATGALAAPLPATVSATAAPAKKHPTWTGVLAEPPSPSSPAADQPTNFCPSCGQKSGVGDRFCRSCGTRLVA
jgi:ribosomal protein L32